VQYTAAFSASSMTHATKRVSKKAVSVPVGGP
jgi:hypothetical protein